MVRGLRVVTPAGVLDLGRAPGRRPGPDLRRADRRLRRRVRHHHPGAGAGASGAGDHPVRGVVVPRLRDRRRRVARRHPDRHRPDRDPAVRRGRDRRQPGHHRDHRRAADHRRLPGDHRVRGHRGTHREQARRDPGAAERARRHIAGRGPARAWEHGRFGAPYLRDSLLAGGRAVRDPGDRHQLVQCPAPEGRRHRGADQLRSPNPARRRWCCATFRMCIPPARRCTSPSSPASEAIRSSSGARPRPRRRDAIMATGAPSPTTTPSAPTIGRGCAPRSASSACEVLRAVKAALDPGRNPQPRQAHPVTRTTCGARSAASPC